MRETLFSFSGDGVGRTHVASALCLPTASKNRVGAGKQIEVAQSPDSHGLASDTAAMLIFGHYIF